jgi:hypothetical protein
MHAGRLLGQRHGIDRLTVNEIPALRRSGSMSFAVMFKPADFRFDVALMVLSYEVHINVVKNYFNV